MTADLEFLGKVRATPWERWVVNLSEYHSAAP